MANSEFIEWLKVFCRGRPEIKRAILFGSFARNDNGPASDIDLAFELTDDSAWGAIALEIRSNAKTLRGLDLINLGGASGELKQRIQEEGVTLFERKKNKTKR